MKKIVACIGLIVLSACGGSPASDAETNSGNQESAQTNEAGTEAEEAKQSVEDRIAEIKDLYASIQKADKSKQKCSSWKSITKDGLDMNMQFPFENTAEECTLPGGLRYQTLERNGYEWSETSHFYYKDDALFFVFIDGGAEACGYQYRIYYDMEGEIIRVLSSENDCDGDDVGKPTEVVDEKKRKEILKTLLRCQKDFMDISGK